MESDTVQNHDGLYPWRSRARSIRHDDIRRLLQVATGCMGHDEEEAAYLLEKAIALLRKREA